MSNYRTYLSIFLGFLLVWGAIGAGAQERFIDNGDGTVTDNLMGLMWAKTDNRADIFWKEALLWIKNNFPKQIGSQYDDWRLPTTHELVSIVDYNEYEPAIDIAVFPGTGPDRYWASNEYVGSSDDAWFVAFNTGWSWYLAKIVGYKVRCVR